MSDFLTAKREAAQQLERLRFLRHNSASPERIAAASAKLARLSAAVLKWVEVPA